MDVCIKRKGLKRKMKMKLATKVKMMQTKNTRTNLCYIKVEETGTIQTDKKKILSNTKQGRSLHNDRLCT